MDTIADFVSKDDEIKRLKRRVLSTHKHNTQLRNTRDRLVLESIKPVELLIKLKKIGLLNMDFQQIADMCFVSKKSVSERSSRMNRLERSEA